MASRTVFTVGQTASFSCSSDLDVNSVEWLHGHQVVLNTTNDHLDLSFSPVNDTIHNQNYICRVTSPYGIQEEIVQVVVESEFIARCLYC